MENLNLDEFNPTKFELTKLAEKYKSLEIKDIEDKEGYLIVDEAIEKLKKTRNEIRKFGKKARSKAIAYQKEVIKTEKELVAIIEPIELDLLNKQKIVDTEIEKRKRIEFLPERHIKLKEIKCIIDDETLLLMDDNEFMRFFNEKKEEYLLKIQEENEKKEEELKKEKLRIQEEKDSIEREKQKQIEIEKARKETAKRVKKEMEEKTIKLEQERVKQELAEKEKTEKNKKYIKFLDKNGYSEKEKENYFIQRDNNKIVLFKKIDEIIL